MMQSAVATTLLPIRDRRDKVVGYIFSSCMPDSDALASAPDVESRATLEQISATSRTASRTLVVPVSPGVVRDGSISRFASTDAVWLLATSALDDAPTRRVVDRLVGQGFHFALDGFPGGEPLLPSLIGSTVVLDAWRTPADLLDARVRELLAAGLRPMVSGVDDRVLRHRMLAAGTMLHTGRAMVRGASARVDRAAEESAVRALTALATYAGGRQTSADFDAFIENDANIGGALLRVMSSAALGVRGPRSVAHAITMLGRDTVMEQLVNVAARLIGEAAGDPELAFIALRRARVCERIGAMLDSPTHVRTRSVAGMLSVLEFALGVPSGVIADRIALVPELRDTLEMRTGQLGMLLDALDALDYGWWDDVRGRCDVLGVSVRTLSEVNTSAWREARDELGLGKFDGA